MKKALLIILTALSIQLQSQTISVPLTRGGQFSGGTILKVDATNGNYDATPMIGKIGNHTPGAQFNSLVSTANSGIHYESSNNSLYIVAKDGDRRVGLGIGAGVIYRYDISSGKTHMIHEYGFDDKQGAVPFGELQNIGGTLYGVTQKGGEFDFGCIYSIDPSNDTYTVLFSFNGASDGGEPRCQLFVDGNVLYGAGGRANGIQGDAYFTYDVSQSTYTPLYLRAGGNTDIKGVLKHNSTLYISIGAGIAELDLTNTSAGITFYYTGVGATNEQLGYNPFEFTFRSGDVSWYTVFRDGGTNSTGSLAKINFSSGNPMSNVHNFQTGNLGQNPSTKLTDGLNGSMYGVASQGTGDDYVLFEFSSIGVYSILHSFTSSNDGLAIQAAPVLVGGKLFGIAEQDGQYGGGTVWSYDLANSTFKVEAQLGYENGRNPLSGLVLNPITSALDFTVQQNGSSSRGALNSFNTSANSYSNITSFSNSNIQVVSHKPFYFNNKVFVMAQLAQGAIATYKSAYGIVEINIATGDIIGNITPIAPDPNLANIGNSFVQGNIIQENNMLYGGTGGLLFSFDLATMTYASLHAYASTPDGKSTGAISMSGDTIYGINEEGGANANGTVYSYNLTSNTFNVLEDVPSNSTYTGVVTSGDNLYTVKLDSAVGYSIAAMDLSAGTPAFSTVAAIDSTSNGYNPGPNLSEFKGIIYGIMNNGGSNNIGGLFKVETSSNTLSQVISFDTITGFYSYNSELYITDITEKPNSINDFSIENEFSIYPNPSNGKYSIDSKDVISFTVYNNVGTLILTKTKSSQLDLTNYSAGIYFIKVETSHGILTKKLIKE